ERLLQHHSQSTPRLLRAGDCGHCSLPRTASRTHEARGRNVIVLRYCETREPARDRVDAPIGRGEIKKDELGQGAVTAPTTTPITPIEPTAGRTTVRGQLRARPPQPPQPTQQTHLTLAQVLKRRGWTRSLVARFLDPADVLRPNPRFRHA